MNINAKFEYAKQCLGKTDRNYCMLSISAPEMKQISARKPLNLAIVIDKSSSMRGAKLAAVKSAVAHLVQNLTSKDILSIIAYNRRVEIVREAEKVFNKQDVIANVNKIFSSGRTNISAGWEQGFKEISEHLKDNYVNRIILLTDGLANEGITDNKALAELGRKYRKDGARTTCMGVGEDFNEELLTQIADESSGNYYYMENAGKIQEFFKEEVGELLNLVAQDIELTVEFKNGIRLRRLLTDYATGKTDENEYSFALDDAYANDEKIILFRLDYPAVHQPDPYEVCTCTVRYKNLLQNNEECIEVFNVLRNVDDHDRCARQVPDEDVLKNVAFFIAAAARKQSYHQNKTGKTELAGHTLFTSSEELSGIADSLEKINSEYGKAVRIESQSLEKDKTSIESKPDKAGKNILFKSRSSFRQKIEYKKQKHETDVREDEEKEGNI